MVNSTLLELNMLSPQVTGSILDRSLVFLEELKQGRKLVSFINRGIFFVANLQTPFTLDSFWKLFLYHTDDA